MHLLPLKRLLNLFHSLNYDLNKANLFDYYDALVHAVKIKIINDYYLVEDDQFPQAFIFIVGCW